MGCGGVGRQLLQHIVSCRSLHAKMGVYLRVVGVCDSESLIAVSDVFSMDLDDRFLSEICQVKLNGSSLLTLRSSDERQVHTKTNVTRKVIDIANHLGKSLGLALVDCSASSETIEALKQAVDLGCCIVLANKKPLTSTMEDYDELVSHPRCIRHESTLGCGAVESRILFYGLIWMVGWDDLVIPWQGEQILERLKMVEKIGLQMKVGAGLPVIASLNRMLSSGDCVRRIVGSLSGTLGYVMSEVEDGKPLSQVVKVAKSLGFTEPDPRDDLSGMDVARKGSMNLILKQNHQDEVMIMGLPGVFSYETSVVALILARLLGSRITLDSIKIESLFPEEMGATVMSIENFLDSGLLVLDKDIQERVNKASLNGNVLRYVCVIEGSRCEVGILEVPKESPLGRLRGSDNVLEIYSRCYDEQPLVIQGAGAGNDTTAAGVLADILEIQDLFPN
ncbi:Bifunctional aspartokinase/homoserine dehydrogenase [Morella rubra]|uniref:Homoserine dehydrogenase n=1 Tax=Morella rubra TaxID=262757 RepID=A0A6A1UIY1_9ROSI|nr:Bifunctional aspartokinase/homoserine dehydrogenase [Morella rubra]